MSNNVIYLGIDVHKETNNVCMYDRTEGTFFAEEKLVSGTEYVVKYIEKTRKDFALGKECSFIIGYEAGPTGYGLCRGLQKKGYECVVMAPTTIKKASGEKVKTDRRDAKMLAMSLGTDGYKKVYLPDLEDEAAKEYTRTRNTLKGHHKKAKQNLLSFLLRTGLSYPESGNYWTIKFWEWIKSIKYEDKLLQFSFLTLVQEVKDLEDKITLMDNYIEEIANTDRYKEKVDKLVCFTGIQTHTALSIIVEIGDFNRFSSAEEFSSYLGLCPGQDSSGKRTKYNAITKTGNTRLRKLLVEGVKGIKKSNPYAKSKRIIARQAGQAPDIIAYADKGSIRIRNKIRKLQKTGKASNVATIAGARELSCFIWGMMTDNIS